MAKLSFEEWKLRREYEAYLKEEGEPEEKKEALEEKKEQPEQKEQPQQKEEPKDEYANDIKEIRAQLAILSKAVSPALGDIKPVGIEDVITNFFNIKKEE